MILVSLILTLSLVVFCFYRFKTIACPPVCLGLVWLISYVFIVAFNGVSSTNSFVYSFFFISYAFFCFGFFLIYPKGNKSSLKIFSTSLAINYSFLRLLLLVDFCISFGFCFFFIPYLSKETSLWTSINRSTTLDFLKNGIYGVFLNFLPIVSLFLFSLYLVTKNRRLLKYFFLSVPSLFPVFVLSSRGVWICIFIGFVFILLFVRKPDNKTIVFFGVILMVLFCLFFILTSLDKYSNAYSQMTFLEKMRYLFLSYFVNPSTAFVEWYQSPHDYYFGAHTFRFVLAVLNKIGFNISVPDTLQPFIEINGVRGNVYTVLYWYSSDFGFWWACIVQFSLGIVFGFLYKVVSLPKNSAFYFSSLMFLSLLMCPLFASFFSDLYFSIFSVWLQRAFFCYLLSKITIQNGSQNFLSTQPVALVSSKGK